MKKLGFVVYSDAFGGLELNALKLAKWLNERGREIVFYYREGSRLGTELSKYPFDKKAIRRQTRYFDVINARRFSKILRADGISQVFLCDNKDLDFIFFTKLFSGQKLKVIYQQQMLIGVNKRDWFHTMRFSAINYWISPLEWLKTQVLKKTRLDAQKIRVIPLCTEVRQFTPPKYSKIEARNILKLHTPYPLLGIVGRIDPLKGQIFLVKAVAELQKLELAVELVIMGEPTLNNPKSGQYFSEIKEFIAANGLSEKIHFRSFSDDVNLFFNAIDIFCLASEAESFGMVTTEAMISGVPVIATNSGGTPEILEEGKLGVLYSYNDMNDFCEKLGWMLKNTEQLNAMTGQAQQVAAKRFSHITECEEIERLLD